MKFQVWLEGYRATGESGQVQYLGEHEATSFGGAVEIALIANKWDMKYFYRANLTYWGCRFFDNGNDAAASFG